jgi:hypothetical protein
MARNTRVEMVVVPDLKVAVVVALVITVAAVVTQMELQMAVAVVDLVT